MIEVIFASLILQGLCSAKTFDEDELLERHNFHRTNAGIDKLRWAAADYLEDYTSPEIHNKCLGGSPDFGTGMLDYHVYFFWHRIENDSASDTFERLYYRLVSRYSFHDDMHSHLSCTWYYPLAENNTVEAAQFLYLWMTSEASEVKCYLPKQNSSGIQY